MSIRLPIDSSKSSAGREHVTLAAHRLDQAVGFTHVTQFPSQLGNTHIYRAIDPVVSDTPQRHQYVVPAKHSRRVTREKPEQIELGIRQVHPLTTDRHGSRPRVDAEAINGQSRLVNGEEVRALLAAAPEQRPKTCQKHLWSNGFGEVIIRSDVQSDHLVDIVTARGEHQNPAAIRRSYSFADLNAIEAREEDIEHDTVRLERRNGIDGGDAVGYPFDPEPMVAEK